MPWLLFALYFKSKSDPINGHTVKHSISVSIASLCFVLYTAMYNPTLIRLVFGLCSLVPSIVSHTTASDSCT